MNILFAGNGNTCTSSIVDKASQHIRIIGLCAGDILFGSSISRFYSEESLVYCGLHNLICVLISKIKEDIGIS